MIASGDAVPTTGRVLGVDVGARRIGLAISDPTQTIAQPLATLSRRRGRRFPLAALQRALGAYRPVGAVIGLPLAPDGTEGAAACEARSIGALVSERLGLAVAYEDERFTTARALGAVRELGGGLRHRKGDVDQLAAVVLLQQYLDRRRPR